MLIGAHLEDERRSPCQRVGRIVFRADDERLTAFAGLAVSGALTRTLGLVGLIDGELARERCAAPVKLRARGVSGGELLLALAESQLIGGECFTTSRHCAPTRRGGRQSSRRAAGAGRVDGAAARQALSALSHARCRARDRAGRRTSGPRAWPRRGRGRDDRSGRHAARGPRHQRRGREGAAWLLGVGAYRVLGAARPRADRGAGRRQPGEADRRGGGDARAPSTAHAALGRAHRQRHVPCRLGLQFRFQRLEQAVAEQERRQRAAFVDRDFLCGPKVFNRP